MCICFLSFFLSAVKYTDICMHNTIKVFKMKSQQRVFFRSTNLISVACDDICNFTAFSSSFLRGFSPFNAFTSPSCLFFSCLAHVLHWLSPVLRLCSCLMFFSSLIFFSFCIFITDLTRQPNQLARPLNILLALQMASVTQPVQSKLNAVKDKFLVHD